jgi:hypothetical protein
MDSGRVGGMASSGVGGMAGGGVAGMADGGVGSREVARSAFGTLVFYPSLPLSQTVNPHPEGPNPLLCPVQRLSTPRPIPTTKPDRAYRRRRPVFPCSTTSLHRAAHTESTAGAPNPHHSSTLRPGDQ